MRSAINETFPWVGVAIVYLSRCWKDNTEYGFDNNVNIKIYQGSDANVLGTIGPEVTSPNQETRGQEAEWVPNALCRIESGFLRHGNDKVIHVKTFRLLLFSLFKFRKYI